MKYAHRIRQGAVYASSADMRLNDDDLVMEWAHTLSTDYRYIQLPPYQRRNYLLKRLLYDQVMEETSGQPRNVQLALALARYLKEKELRLEGAVLAGAYQFSDHVYTHPFDEQEELECAMEEAGAHGIAWDAPAFARFLNYVRCGFCTKNPSGHVIPDYPRLLSLGWGGILSKVQGRLRQDPDNSFLRACQISVEAAQHYILRWSELAHRAGLADMAQACRWISANPPRTFYEAVQLIALTHELAISEQLSGSISFGRFDAYVTPFYLADLANGRVTPEAAYGIVLAMFEKIGNNRLAFQNMTLGGLNEEGTGYLPTDVTKMCLRASIALHKDEPMLTLRVNRHMPPALWDDILCSIRGGTGFPALFNDDVVIAAKERVGASRLDAQAYGMIGCVEICCPGKEFSHAEGLRINWAKVLEVALHGGIDPMTNTPFPMKAPQPLSAFTHFAQFYEWFVEEFLFTVDQMIEVVDACERYYPHRWPLSLMSSLMEGCIEKGLDVTAGGTTYNNTSINHTSMANLADSLQAIRKCVFEERLFTLEQLGQMLLDNFDGHAAQRTAIGHMLDRYGNGHQDSEGIMRDIARRLHDHLKDRRNCRGGQYQMGYYSVWAQATLGALTGALPDGRLKGTPLANSLSPVQGCEKNGPTAVAVSATALDHTTFGNGMVLDYKFSPNFFDTAAHRSAFRGLVEGYFALGGMEMQFNVVDRHTLLDAQRHPEDHENLIVRVSGYSAFFNDLSKVIQDEIIQRTQFA